LNEPNEFFLPNSLDSSFQEISGSMGMMSSQFDGGRFGLDDDLLDPGADLGLDLGQDIGWEDPIVTVSTQE
jgi:hypothetical protein